MSRHRAEALRYIREAANRISDGYSLPESVVALRKALIEIEAAETWEANDSTRSHWPAPWPTPIEGPWPRSSQ